MATIRALKMHGGVGKIVAGKPLDPALLERERRGGPPGGANLAKQIENVRLFGVPVVVAINSFPTDTPAEVEAIKEVALAAGAATRSSRRTSPSGGEGAEALAQAVWARRRDGAPDFKLLYPDDDADRREDRDDRDPASTAPTASTSCRRRARQLEQYEDAGLRPPADLHGQDASTR